MKKTCSNKIIPALLSTFLLVIMVPIPVMAAAISATANEINFENQPAGATQPEWKDIIITNNGTEMISLFDGRFTGGGSYVENGSSRSEWFEITPADAAIEWMDENGTGHVFLNSGESIAYWRIRPLQAILATPGYYTTIVETQCFDEWGRPPMQTANATISFRVGDENSVTDSNNKISIKSNYSSSSISEPIDESPTNVVTLSGGSSVTSTIHGVYNVNVVDGVAITTSLNDVKNALGIVDEKTNVSSYFCDSQNSAVNEALKNIAGSQDKTVVACFNADMYSITKQGTIESIRESNESITMVFGIPKHLQGKTFAITCQDKNGNTVIFEDIDGDPNTITINANVFGIYALVY